MTRTIQTIPVNRVEGDLEIRVEMDADGVRNAWSVGTMYRGFENILRGRGALDGLVITPRICGICSTSHLKAAAKALDTLYHARVPDNGIRIRNIALGVEKLQSDLRHTLLLFMGDTTNPAYQALPLYPEAVARYAPLKGKSAVQAVSRTARVIEIIAILGGQWPHASFMVPGGVVSAPGKGEIAQCRMLLHQYRRYYEQEILGCGLSRWLAVKSLSDLAHWLDESTAHQEGDLGFFLRFSRLAGLDHLGAGCGNYISFGSLDIPALSGVTGGQEGRRLFPAGFLNGNSRSPMNTENITEDISHAWFRGEADAQHPAVGATTPYASGNEGKPYSWAKAPRYRGLPAETGPLAELAHAEYPLIVDLLAQKGPSVFTRQLARIVRPALLFSALDTWLAEIAEDGTPGYQDCDPRTGGTAHGLVDAPRGALGHWVTLKTGKIASYQIITPTTWNASPRDTGGTPGPMEQALAGTRVKDPANPIEVAHVVRSFDPCLVCTVHSVDLE